MTAIENISRSKMNYYVWRTDRKDNEKYPSLGIALVGQFPPAPELFYELRIAKRYSKQLYESLGMVCDFDSVLLVVIRDVMLRGPQHDLYPRPWHQSFSKLREAPELKLYRNVDTYGSYPKKYPGPK